MATPNSSVDINWNSASPTKCRWKRLHRWHVHVGQSNSRRHNVAVSVFLCQNWQNAGFAGSLEPAKCRRDSATTVARTRHLMIRPTAQHGGVYLPCQYRQKSDLAGLWEPTTGFARDTYTLADEMTDCATWFAYMEREDRKKTSNALMFEFSPFPLPIFDFHIVQYWIAQTANRRRCAELHCVDGMMLPVKFVKYINGCRKTVGEIIFHWYIISMVALFYFLMSDTTLVKNSTWPCMCVYMFQDGL